MCFSASLLVCQALEQNLTVITVDDVFRGYPAPLLERFYVNRELECSYGTLHERAVCRSNRLFRSNGGELRN